MSVNWNKTEKTSANRSNKNSSFDISVSDRADVEKHLAAKPIVTKQGFLFLSALAMIITSLDADFSKGMKHWGSKSFIACMSCGTHSGEIVAWFSDEKKVWPWDVILGILVISWLTSKLSILPNAVSRNHCGYAERGFICSRNISWKRFKQAISKFAAWSYLKLCFP